MAPIIEFFLQVVGNGVVLGGIHDNSKKIENLGCMHSDVMERGRVQSLDKTSDERLSRICF